MTRRTKALFVAAAVALLFPAGSSAAEVFEALGMVGFQGHLTDLSGNAIDAPGGLKFEVGLYHDASGGMPFWSDSYEAVAVEKGTFYVLLGSGKNPLPTLELDGTVKYLGLKVNDSPELEPRLQIVSVPYAMRAGMADTADVALNADKLGGKAADQFVTVEKITDYGPQISSLEKKIQDLESQVELLKELVKNPGCVDDCVPAETGCSEDMLSAYTCGEGGDGDACMEKLFVTCTGKLKCVSGQCICAPGFSQVCLGDDAYEQSSCGKPGKLVAKCGEGLCTQSEGKCTKWRRETPLQQAGLNGIFTIGGHLYAVGNAGLVVHYDGAEWTTMAAPTTLNLHSIWGHKDSGSVELFAVGEKGKMIQYKAGEWKTVITGVYHDLNAIYGISGSSIIAVGNKGTVLRYDGTSWKLQAFAPDVAWINTSFSGVYAASASKVWIGGNAAMLVHFDGDTWVQQQAPDGFGGDIKVMWGSSALSVWAGATGGKILHFVSEWKLQNPSPETSATFRSIWGKTVPAPQIFAVGDDSNVYQSDTVVWAKVDKPSQGIGSGASIIGVRGSDAPQGAMWMVASDGRVAYLTADDKWAFPAVTRSVTGLFGLPGSEANQWAVGTDCLALRFTNKQWLSADIDGGTCAGGSGTQDFKGIWGLDPTTIIAVGEEGMYKLWDGTAFIPGEGETAGPPGNDANNDIWGTGATNLLVVRSSATWIRSGGAWQSTGGGGGVAGYGTSMTDFWVVDGATGNVHRFDGSEWSKEAVATAALKDVFCQEGEVWVVGDGGTVFQRTGGDWVDRSIKDVLGSDQLTSVWLAKASPVHVAARKGYAYVLEGGKWSYERTFPATDHLVVRGITATNVLLGGVKTIYRRK